jgi:hypothetical protein
MYKEFVAGINRHTEDKHTGTYFFNVNYIGALVIIMSDGYQETLNGESLSRYKSKLSVINSTECSYKPLKPCVST